MSNLIENPRQLTQEETQAFEASRRLLTLVNIPELLVTVQQESPRPEDSQFSVHSIQDKLVIQKDGEIDTTCSTILETKTKSTTEKGLPDDDCNQMWVYRWKEVTVTADASLNIVSFRGKQVRVLTPMEYAMPTMLKQALSSALDRPRNREQRVIPTDAYD